MSLRQSPSRRSRRRSAPRHLVAKQPRWNRSQLLHLLPAPRRSSCCHRLATQSCRGRSRVRLLSRRLRRWSQPSPAGSLAARFVLPVPLWSALGTNRRQRLRCSASRQSLHRGEYRRRPIPLPQRPRLQSCDVRQTRSPLGGLRHRGWLPPRAAERWPGRCSMHQSRPTRRQGSAGVAPQR